MHCTKPFSQNNVDVKGGGYANKSINHLTLERADLLWGRRRGTSPRIRTLSHRRTSSPSKISMLHIYLTIYLSVSPGTRGSPSWWGSPSSHPSSPSTLAAQGPCRSEEQKVRGQCSKPNKLVVHVDLDNTNSRPSNMWHIWQANMVENWTMLKNLRPWERRRGRFRWGCRRWWRRPNSWAVMNQF